MDSKSLIAAGLAPSEAEAYALLIEAGEIKPPEAAKRLKLSRTNAYKVLDRLAELGLAVRAEKDKTLSFSPANPLALASLVAKDRSAVVAREEAVNHMMNTLLADYYKHNEQPSVTVKSGKQAVADLYRQQIGLNEDIYFIHTPADIAMMGYDTMHDIRVMPARRGKQRHGILREPSSGKPNYEPHKRSHLDITWAAKGSYDAPVEWSVTESSLLIILFANEPHAIMIVDKVIAGAFLQLYKLLAGLLRAQPTHQKLIKS